MNNAARRAHPHEVRAAIYARVSTDEQAQEGTSIGTQLERCRKTITDKEWIPSGEFVDEGVSGSKDSRPALDKLMEECRSGRVNAIVVSKLDRFTRSLAHLSSAIDELDDLGVAFVSVAESFDASTISGQAMAGMLGVFAQMERRTIAERGASGQRARAMAGQWPGGTAPFALMTEPAPDGGGRIAVIHPQEAETIHLMVGLLVDGGLTTGEIAARLNVLSVKPRHAARWTHHIVRRTLENRALIGEMIWAREGLHLGQKRSSGKYGGELRVTVPRVLDQETWERVQTALMAKRLGPRLRNKVYPLSNGALVGPCHENYHGAWRSDRQSREYWCRNAKVTPVKTERCSCPRVKADDIEAAVMAEIIRLMTDPKRLQQLAAERLAIAAPKGDTATELSEVNRRIGMTERKLTVEVEKAMEAGVDVTVLKGLSDHLGQELRALRAHRETLVASVAQAEDAQSAVDRLSTLAKQGRRALEDLDLVGKAALIKLMDIRVEILAGSTARSLRLRIIGCVPHAELADQLSQERQLHSVKPQLVR